MHETENKTLNQPLGANSNFFNFSQIFCFFHFSAFCVKHVEIYNMTPICFSLFLLTSIVFVFSSLFAKLLVFLKYTQVFSDCCKNLVISSKHCKSVPTLSTDNAYLDGTTNQFHSKKLNCCYNLQLIFKFHLLSIQLYIIVHNQSINT